MMDGTVSEVAFDATKSRINLNTHTHSKAIIEKMMKSRPSLGVDKFSTTQLLKDFG